MPDYMFGRKNADARDHDGGLAGWAVVALVFMPFAAGYFLSYLFRTINGVVSARLAAELGLSAADLGLITAVYFLVLAAAQIKGRERFEGFVEALGRRLQKGQSFLREIPEDFVRKPPEEPGK